MQQGESQMVLIGIEPLLSETPKLPAQPYGNYGGRSRPSRVDRKAGRYIHMITIQTWRETWPSKTTDRTELLRTDGGEGFFKDWMF